MKPQTEQRYLARVEHAAGLIAANIDAPPAADSLAAAVGISRFHFQRIYRAATGETVLETMHRLRAVRALELLAAGYKVTEVASEVGYETPQAFARAFKQWTGTTPSRARARADLLARRFRQPEANPATPLDIEITSIEPVRLAVIRTRRPFGPLNDVYETLFDAVAREQRLDEVTGIYGQPENDPVSEPDGIEKHVAGVALGPDPLAGFKTIDLDRAPALCCRHIGSFEKIDETAIALYRHVIDRKVPLADSPPLHHHLDDPEDVPVERLRTDIYLERAEPVKGGEQ